MGAKTRLIYNNLWRKGTGLLPASPVADPQHPVTDSQTDTKSMYFQSSTLDHPLLLPMDLGGEKEVNFVAILGHNIESSEVTITFEGDTGTEFSGGDWVSRPIKHNDTNIFQFIEPFKKQYVQLRLVKGSNFMDYPQVATILCGKYAELNRRFAPEYEVGEEDFSEMEYGDSQVLFAQEKETLNIRRYSYQALNDASKDHILAMFKECKTIKAFAFCHDYSDPNSNTLWVRNSELNSPICRNGVWYWEMAIKEVK